jgi:hypothetical protein
MDNFNIYIVGNRNGRYYVPDVEPEQWPTAPADAHHMTWLEACDIVEKLGGNCLGQVHIQSSNPPTPLPAMDS